MIKKNDLRIGDWVFFYAGYDKEESHNDTVRAIGEQYGGDSIFLDRCGGDPINENELFPIVLTKEIAKRNGFHSAGFTQLYRVFDQPERRVTWDYSSHLLVITRDDSTFERRKRKTMLSMFCDDVHHFQHLLKETGIDVELKITDSDDIDWSQV